jgi:Ca2+-binding EF-hand superfamily protein
MDSASHDEVVSDVLHRIQIFVYPRRLRAKEYFLDFDSLKHGRCTKINFERGIESMGIHLKDYEVACLAEHFTERGPQVQEPQVVNYVKFCSAVDEVFSQHGETAWGIASMRNSPTMGKAASQSTLVAHIKGTDEEEEKLDKLQHRIASLCRIRGVTFKDCYTDHDRAPIASPSRMHGRASGKCSMNQFMRGFPFKKEFTPEDIAFVAECYSIDHVTVHFMALHHEVSELMVHEGQPFPQSPLTIRADPTEWSHTELSTVVKLRSKIVERRVRTYEQFQDFDALRKGCVTAGQVKTVFTILNIAKEISKEEFDQLLADYSRPDGMFCYKDFCRDVESDFTTPYLERSPKQSTMMPDRSHTAPARRNEIVLSAEKRKKIDALESKMQYRVRTRGLNMKPCFQDLDKAHRGYVTKNQFGRILGMLGFELGQPEVNLLCEAYCNLGNHIDVNYVDFTMKLEQADGAQMLAMEQAAGPLNEGMAISKYFDHGGKVHKALDVM